MKYKCFSSFQFHFKCQSIKNKWNVCVDTRTKLIDQLLATLLFTKTEMHVQMSPHPTPENSCLLISLKGINQ